MKTYNVRYSVDGKGGFSVIVSAPNSGSARQVAMGEIQGQAGYVGRRITITAVSEIR